MGPSSSELTCPVNATFGELAAPIILAAAKNSVTAATAMAIARKVFFSMGVLRELISRVILDDPASSWPLLALGARFGQGGFIAKVWRQLTANRAGAGVSACPFALRLPKGKSHIPANCYGPPGAGGATDTPRIPDLSIAWATSPEAFTSSMNSRRYFAATSRPFGVPSA